MWTYATEILVFQTLNVTLPQTRLIFLKENGQTLKTRKRYHWLLILKLGTQNVDYLTDSFLNKMNSLLSNYTPLNSISFNQFPTLV